MTDCVIAKRSTIPPDVASSAGLFSWDIIADSISGDAEMARLLRFDPGTLNSGVGVRVMMAHIHADDRERVARSLHTAIVDGSLSCEIYRVEAQDGGYRQVLCLARCFGYDDGLPTVCSGFVCEIDAAETQAEIRYPNGENVVPMQRRGS